MTASTTTGPVLHLLRITIEAVSPLSTASGDTSTRIVKGEKSKPDSEYQSATLLRDANGLPMIAGASLQGVLRRLYEQAHNRERTDALFGREERDKQHGTLAARLFVGFGYAHESNDVAVIGLLGANGDQVLQLLREEAPLRRDHVALNHRHVVDGRQKFDRTSVPGGTRFSFELSMWGQTGENEASALADEAVLKSLVALINSEGFRVGGATRRGYGRVKLVRATYARPLYETISPDALCNLRRQPPSQSLNGNENWQVWTDTPALATPGAVVATLVLTPIGVWRIGGADSASLTYTTQGVRANDGTKLVRQAASQIRGFHMQGNQRIEHEKPATALREKKICWSPTGQIVNETIGQNITRFNEEANALGFVVPGSAIKGPLVHRALFHFNRMLGTQGIIEIDDAATAADLEILENNSALLQTRRDALAVLLGEAKSSSPDLRQSEAGDTGRASSLLVDDASVTGVKFVQIIDHNSIDRFTGGTRQGKYNAVDGEARGGTLYAEEVLVGGEIVVTMTILAPAGTGEWDENATNPLLHALYDLCHGRLALGAKSLGFCKGTLTWTGDSTKWQEKWQAVVDGRAQPRVAA